MRSKILKRKEPLISLKKVSVNFGDKEVLQEIDFDIFPGESVAIIGTSGCGKSVTMKLLLALLKPSFGKVIWNPKHFKDKAEFYNSIGAVYQHSALFDSLSVFENICFSLLQNDKITKDFAYRRGKKLANAVGLETKLLDASPSDLSGGMKKRAALARALANDPKIIFFDEPTTGLDPVMTSLIANLTAKTIKDNKATALTITHDLSLAKKIATRVCMLHGGKFVWQGSVKQMLTSKNKYIQQFLHGSLSGPINPYV